MTLATGVKEADAAANITVVELARVRLMSALIGIVILAFLIWAGCAGYVRVLANTVFTRQDKRQISVASPNTTWSSP